MKSGIREKDFDEYFCASGVKKNNQDLRISEDLMHTENAFKNLSDDKCKP